jgi:anaerobic ribonucleoside-triphosphate reductase activating protein
MQLRLFGTEKSSIVDGPGIRFAVFLQGCPHDCPGCHNPKSHDINGGVVCDTEDISKEFSKNPLLKGITLSGGEPLLQAEACLALALEAKKLGLDVWLYTGYLFEDILNSGNGHIKQLLKHVDCIVDGPFIMAERSLDLLYKGSRNQRIIDVQKSLNEGKAVLWEAPEW